MVGGSGDQSADYGAEKRFASFARIVEELEEPEVDWKFVLCQAAVWS